MDVRDARCWKALSADAIAAVCGYTNSSELQEHFARLLAAHAALASGLAEASGLGRAAPLYSANCAPPLCASGVDAVRASNELELALRQLVAEWRRDRGLSTVWDGALSYVLTQAIGGYELERVAGAVGRGSACEDAEGGSPLDEFQAAVRLAVPEGHTFKGFPIQFVHLNARRAFLTALKCVFAFTFTLMISVLFINSTFDFTYCTRRSPVCADLLATRGDSVRFALRARVYNYAEDAVAAWCFFAVKYKSVL